VDKEKRFCYDIETTGLDCFEHRITCISIIDIDSEAVQSFYGDDEQKLIQNFWTAVKDAKLLVGFNNHSFDWPFLLRRSLFYAIKIIKVKQMDLRKEASGFWEHYDKKISGKLSDYTKKLTGEEPGTNGGSKMPQLYLEGKWEEIKDHCEEDIKLTKLLFDRCEECNFFSIGGYVRIAI